MRFSIYGTWDLPGPGIKPVSPAVAGGFLTTVPPGKSCVFFLKKILIKQHLFKWASMNISQKLIHMYIWQNIVNITLYSESKLKLYYSLSMYKIQIE